MGRYTGRIVRWEDERGYGFVAPDGGGGEVFVHVRDVGRGRPRVGDELAFSMGQDKHGRPCAVRGALGGGASYGGASTGRTALAWYNAALLFFVVLAGVGLTEKLHGGVVLVYLVLSVVAFCTYAADKSAARKGGWRVSEPTLHFWALLGGWPGAIIAQQWLRHKSAKKAFRATFYFTVALNCVVLGLVVWFGAGSVVACLRGLAR
jgi:uncharacterized membrane protein YsdA (DUF1294 family)/cold shock CspA family protein